MRVLSFLFLSRYSLTLSCLRRTIKCSYEDLKLCARELIFLSAPTPINLKDKLTTLRMPRLPRCYKGESLVFYTPFNNSAETQAFITEEEVCLRKLGILNTTPYYCFLGMAMIIKPSLSPNYIYAYKWCSVSVVWTSSWRQCLTGGALLCGNIGCVGTLP